MDSNIDIFFIINCRSEKERFRQYLIHSVDMKVCISKKGLISAKSLKLAKRLNFAEFEKKSNEKFTN